MVILETIKTKIVSKEIMDPVKEKLLVYLKDKILKDGFYKTTMGEIASELKLSKKTIYKYFPSKTAMVEELMKIFRQEIADKMKNQIARDDNAVVKMVNIMAMASQTLIKLSDKTLKELSIHMPQVWSEIEEFRHTQMTKNFTLIIDQGKKEGLIKNHPTEIMLTIFIASVKAVINPQFLINNKFSMKEALSLMFEFIFDGILTAKGKAILKKSKHRISI